MLYVSPSVGDPECLISYVIKVLLSVVVMRGKTNDQLTKRSDLQLCLSNLAFEAWTDFQTAFLVVGL